MTEYFVDASQAGGNGLTVTSAFASVLSQALAPGDRMWMRRTHFETLANSTTPGQFHRASNRASQVAWVIGWPGSGDPFYDDRPTAGRTAWDVDTSAQTCLTSFGMNMPTLSASNAAGTTGITVGQGLRLANLCVNNLYTSTGHFGFRNPLGAAVYWAPRTRMDNMFFLSAGDRYPTRFLNDMRGNFGKMTFVFSYINVVPTFGSLIADYVVVHSLSRLNSGGLMSNSGMIGIGVLEIQSSSCDFILDQGRDGAEGTSSALSAVHIKRLVGQQPSVAPVINVGNNNWGPVTIDDYYGQGPAQLVHSFCVNGLLATSVDAMYNSQRAWRFDVGSAAATVVAYGEGYQTRPVIRKQFSVTSGTAITISVPIYVGSSAVYSFSQNVGIMKLLARGCMPLPIVSSMIFAGSATPWTGSLIAGGSMYMYKATWTPIETGVVPFEFMSGIVHQPDSGTMRTGFWIFGGPE